MTFRCDSPVVDAAGVLKSRATWPQTFIVLAHTLAVLRSKDPNRAVGALTATRDGQILDINYNGLLPGEPDTIAFWHGKDRQGCRHAEVNAIDRLLAPYPCAPGELDMFVSHVPCPPCARDLAKNGKVGRVFVPSFVVDNYTRRGPEKVAEIEESRAILEAAGIELIVVPVTAELFQAVADDVERLSHQKEPPPLPPPPDTHLVGQAIWVVLALCAMVLLVLSL